MTTHRQAAANRHSSGSRGPRGAAGRGPASRNALRHGFAALTHRMSPVSDSVIESFARALCGAEVEDPALLERARIVAAHAMTLRSITEHQTAVVERLYDDTAIALRKGDNSLMLMKARFMQAWIADYEIHKQAPALLEKYKDELPAVADGASKLPPVGKIEDVAGIVMPSAADLEAMMLVPLPLLGLLHEPYTAEQQHQALHIAREKVAELGRDDHKALAEALPDLLRLERYAYRTWVRLRRAIYAFMDIKLMLTLKEDAAQKCRLVAVTRV